MQGQAQGCLSLLCPLPFSEKLRCEEMENRLLWEGLSISRWFNAAPRTYSAIYIYYKQLGRLASHIEEKKPWNLGWCCSESAHPSGFRPQPIKQWPLGTMTGLVAAGRTRGAVFIFQPERRCRTVALQEDKWTWNFQFWLWEQTSWTKGWTIRPITSKQELIHVRMMNLNCCLDASAAPQGEPVLRSDQVKQWERSQVFTKSLIQGWKSHLTKCCVGLLVRG